MTAVQPRVVRASGGVPSCHSDAGGRPAGSDDPVVALAGAPNSGKSTLFNALTGARRTVGNWPGTTVEVGRGGWRAGTAATELLDLPGAYSLDAVSPDEELTRDAASPATTSRTPWSSPSTPSTSPAACTWWRSCASCRCGSSSR